MADDEIKKGRGGKIYSGREREREKGIKNGFRSRMLGVSLRDHFDNYTLRRISDVKDNRKR